MAKFLTPLITEAIDDKKYVRLVKPFIFTSDVLKDNGFLCVVKVPTGFVMDYESVPIIKATSKRSGVGHDYLYRIDSLPCVPKHIADKVYYELMKSRGNAWWRRIIKYYTVKFFGKSSYHKHKVMATYEELCK